MTASGRGYTAFAGALAALVAVYLAGTSAVYFAPDHGAVASFWPAAGLAVGLLALAPRSWWPVLVTGIVVAGTLANITGGRDLGISVCFGLANASEAVVAGLILKVGEDDRPTLANLDDFLRLVRAAFAGAATIATGAALTVLAFGSGDFTSSWLQVFASHGASTLVIVPVAMAISGGSGRRRTTETIVQGVALVAVTVAVFAPQQSVPLAFAPLPLLVWAALRFDVRIVALELLVVSVMCTVLTAQGLGPFGAAVASGASTPLMAGTMVQIWLLSAAVMSLPLTAVIEQRRHLLAELSEREELFRRNFTDSITGMLLLRPRSDRLEIIDANLAALRLLGSGGAPLVGRYLDRVLANPSAVRRHLQQVISGELAGWTDETNVAERPGTRVNISVSVLAAGRSKVFAAQVLDVTAEHEARIRIEEAERLTSTTLDTTAGLVIMTDLRGRLLRVNAATCDLTGYSEEELLRRPIWETITPPEIVEMIRRRYDDPTRLIGSQESDVLRKDGERLRVLWKNNLVHDQHGDPRYVVLTGLDVTEERSASGLVTHLLNAAITTALVGIDGRGRITLMNSGAQQLLGYAAEDFVGRPFVDLLDRGEFLDRTSSSPTPGTFQALAAAIGPSGESRAADWKWVAADGTRHTMSMTLSVTAADGVHASGYLCVGRDVTEQRHSQQMLMAALEKERHAVERLRKLDAAKNEFVSTVSHELRTPITSIVGYTEMLREGEVVDPHPEQLPMLATIARNGDRLITICNDLLTLGGLDSGATTWERDVVDLTAMLGHVEDVVRPLRGSRDLKVTFHLPEAPVRVLGDRVQLERAMNNLVSNALKFTEDGGQVTCTLERSDGEAVMVVADTGIGIPVDEQDGLFEKFFRSSTAQARAIPGTGLGLSIVAGIIASHGGRIGVESAHLEGTTFAVRLPIAPEAAGSNGGSGTR